MFDELIKKGYRVEPQVRCGGFRIDFVIEGSEGRRLAVECDGDRFHGPGQWADDMTRQTGSSNGPAGPSGAASLPISGVGAPQSSRTSSPQ